MLKHFINIIYVGVITILMVACAEPYDNELSEEPAEIVEDIEEPVELIADIYEYDSIESSEEPAEIVKESHEDPSNEIIADIEELHESTVEGTTADKLNAIIDDFMKNGINEYYTTTSFNLPSFCSTTRGPLGQFAYACSMPRFFDIDYGSAVDALGDLYDSSIEYCTESYSKDCSTAGINDVIIVATIMQKLGLLPANCDSSIGGAQVFCSQYNGNGWVYCEQLTPEYTEYTQQINEIEPICNMPDTYYPRNDGQYYVVNSYNGITIRMH